MGYAHVCADSPEEGRLVPPWEIFINYVKLSKICLRPAKKIIPRNFLDHRPNQGHRGGVGLCSAALFKIYAIKESQESVECVSFHAYLAVVKGLTSITSSHIP